MSLGSALVQFSCSMIICRTFKLRHYLGMKLIDGDGGGCLRPSGKAQLPAESVP